MSTDQQNDRRRRNRVHRADPPETPFQRLLPYGIVGVAFALSYSLTAWAKQLFAPDSMYYAAKAFRFSGMGQEEAAAAVAAHTTQFGWVVPPVEALFGWDLVQPRIVYSALSAPMVRLFGANGLGVVSGVALLLLIGTLVWMLRRRYGDVAAVAAVLLVVSSTQVMFFGAAMLTESLSALWTTLTVLVAWRHVHSPSRTNLWLLVLLTVISAFTRQATLIPAGAFIVLWLAGRLLRREERWTGATLAVAGTAIATQLLQGLIYPSFSQTDQFLRKTEADSLGEALRNTPDLVWSIMAANARQFATEDLAIAVLLAIAVTSMIVLWREPESHMLFGALLAIALYNITNGTPVGIRYAMPGLVFFVMSAALLVSRASASAVPPRHDRAEAEAALLSGEER